MRPIQVASSAIVLALLTLLGAGRAAAQVPGYNPDGTIRTDGWLFLYPLFNPYGCDGGGPTNMLRPWVAPHDPAAEAVKDGTRWGDIDFGGEAVALGYGLADLWASVEKGEDPVRWFAYRDLLGLPGVLPPRIAPPLGDVVDIAGTIAFLNATVLPHLPIGRQPFLSVNGLAIAQTFVRNVTRTPICVNVCTRSDDSIQVWVNGKLVTNASVCRVLPEGCGEREPAVLEPGVNQITVLVWQGDGDWAFSLGLDVDSVQGPIRLTDASRKQVEFLGPDAGGAVLETSLPALTRSVSNPDGCPLTGPVTVRILGNGEGRGTVSISETYLKSEVGSITKVSNGGKVTSAAVAPFYVISWDVDAAILNKPGVTYQVDVPPGTVAHPQGTFTYQDFSCETVGGESLVRGSWPHTGPIGPFDDSHDIGSAADLADGAGGLSVLAGPDRKLGTADDLYEIKGSGADVWDNGDSFHFAYRRFSGDFRATVRIDSRVFPKVGGRWGRYGLMARADCAPDSKYSLVAANLEADPGPDSDHPRGDAVYYQFRRSHRTPGTSDASQFLVFPDPDGAGPLLINQPDYFRLERRGAVLTGYASFDGKSWKLIGSDTWSASQLPPDQPLLVGIFYSKHGSAPQPGLVRFREFDLGPPPVPERFANDAQSLGLDVYRNDFDAVPDGSLPAELKSNCAGDCAAFTPRVVKGRLRLTQEGAVGQAVSVFLDRKVPLPAASGKIIVEYTVYATHTPTANNPAPADGITMAILAGRSTSRVGGIGGSLGYAGHRPRLRRHGAQLRRGVRLLGGRRQQRGGRFPRRSGGLAPGDRHRRQRQLHLAEDDRPPGHLLPQGVRHRVELTSEGHIAVFLPAGGGQAGGGGDETPVLEGDGEPLSSQGNGDAVVGFTGGTGADSQTTEIDDVVVTVVDCSDSPETAMIQGPDSAQPFTTVLLDGRGSSSGGGGDPLEFSWSVISGSATLDTTGIPDGTVNVAIQDGDVIVGLTADDHRCGRVPTGTTTHTIQVVTGGNWVAYDATGDGLLDLSDPIRHLGILFSGEAAAPCPDALDFTGDGLVDISDPIAALNFLFQGGVPPSSGLGCQAFPGCGQDGGCP